MRYGRFIFYMLVLPWVALAAPEYTMNYIVPAGGQQGTEVDVLINGSYIDEPEDLVFYRPGLEVVKFFTTETVLDERSGKPIPFKSDKHAWVKIRIAPDAPVGEHPFRFRTRRHLSPVSSFYVTPYPIYTEAQWYEEANDTREQAEAIQLNTTVFGRTPYGPPQDYDWYEFEAEAKQAISIEVVGQKLGTYHHGGMNDPAIKVFDPSGIELAHCDDSDLLIADPVLSFITPSKGTYTIRMYQQMDYETSARYYLMHVY